MPARRARQARYKAPRNGAKESESQSGSSSAEMENEGFVVDLFLDGERQVRLTQILHVKSNDGEAWDGWDENRLLGFLVQRGQLSIPAPEKDLVPPPVSRELAAEPLSLCAREAVGPAPPAVLTNLRGVEILVSGASGPVPCLSRGEPFEVRLVWEENLLPLRNAAGLGYSASISAWGRESGANVVLALDCGVLRARTGDIRVRIPAPTLTPGAYSLRADVAVTTLVGAAPDGPPTLVASLRLKSRLLQVLGP